VAVVVLGSAGCKATGGTAGLGDWSGAAKGSAPGQDSVQVPTGGESRGAAGAGAGVVDVGDGGCGGLRQAWDGVPDGGLAAASLGTGGGDAKKTRNVSDAAGYTMCRARGDVSNNDVGDQCRG
jgi:hypothetical protein